MPSSITTLGEVRRLVARWAPRLGLLGYEVHVRAGDAEELGGCAAQVAVGVQDYREAVIELAPWAIGRAPYPEGMMVERDGWTPARVEATVVHELLHIAVKPMTRTLELIDGHLHRDSASILDRAHRAAEERVVDALAVALVEAWEE